MTQWSSDRDRLAQRQTLLERARPWTEHERLVIAEIFYEELLSQYPSLRGHFQPVDMPALARKFAQTLGLLLSLDDDRQRLGTEAMRLGAMRPHRALTAAEYRMFSAVLAHVLAQFQNDVPYQQARQIWQADLDAIIEVMWVVRSEEGEWE